MQTVAIVRTLQIASKEPQPKTESRSGIRSHLAIHTAEGIQLIPFQEIIRAESASNYCMIHLMSGQRIMASRTLRCLEEILPAHSFVRTHKSHLVRVTEIRTIHQDEVVMNDGRKLPLSRHQRGQVLDRLHSFAIKL